MKSFVQSVLVATVLAISPFTHAVTDVAPNLIGVNRDNNVVLAKQKAVKHAGYKPKLTKARKIKPSKQIKRAKSDYYTNSVGQRIHRPTKTAGEGYHYRCRDGSYSYSAKRRGACSHHGGIAR